MLSKKDTFHKHGKLVGYPLFSKNGDRSVLKNYRPTVMINNFSWVFENLLCDYLFHYVKSFICFEQHGFFSGKSTFSNFMCSTQYVNSHLDKMDQVDRFYRFFEIIWSTGLRCSPVQSWQHCFYNAMIFQVISLGQIVDSGSPWSPVAWV